MISRASYEGRVLGRLAAGIDPDHGGRAVARQEAAGARPIIARPRRDRGKGKTVCGRECKRYTALSVELVCRQTRRTTREDGTMAESVYKVIELVGTSSESWEKAAAAAIERAGQSLRDMRIAEVAELDVQIKDGKIEAYRAKVKVSFKYEGGA